MSIGNVNVCDANGDVFPVDPVSIASETPVNPVKKEGVSEYILAGRKKDDNFLFAFFSIPIALKSIFDLGDKAIFGPDEDRSKGFKTLQELTNLEGLTLNIRDHMIGSDEQKAKGEPVLVQSIVEYFNLKGLLGGNQTTLDSLNITLGKMNFLSPGITTDDKVDVNIQDKVEQAKEVIEKIRSFDRERAKGWLK